MRLPHFVHRFFKDEEAHLPPKTSEAVTRAEALIDELQPFKQDLASKLERTGFLLGDAVMGRIDRRYLDDRGTDHA